ncbi:MAG: helix-turn-helix transcriptional regulator [Treponema sp.]|nr:helix-turn-helix transcriptional regulator [Treponema sp.]
MSFWENVDVELEYLGMNRTALANAAGFSISNIGKGIQKGSSPSADTAVKIAKILGVSVEYLVTGTTPPSRQKEMDFHALRNYHKYAKTIEDLDALPTHEREPIIEMISKMKEKQEN